MNSLESITLEHAAELVATRVRVGVREKRAQEPAAAEVSPLTAALVGGGLGLGGGLLSAAGAEKHRKQYLRRMLLGTVLGAGIGGGGAHLLNLLPKQPGQLEGLLRKMQAERDAAAAQARPYKDRILGLFGAESGDAAAKPPTAGSGQSAAAGKTEGPLTQTQKTFLADGGAADHPLAQSHQPAAQPNVYHAKPGEAAAGAVAGGIGGTVYDRQFRPVGLREMLDLNNKTLGELPEIHRDAVTSLRQAANQPGAKIHDSPRGRPRVTVPDDIPVPVPPGKLQVTKPAWQPSGNQFSELQRSVRRARPSFRGGLLGTVGGALLAPLIEPAASSVTNWFKPDKQ